MEKYNTVELLNVLNNVNAVNEKVDNYFMNFTEEQIIIKKQNARNTAFVALNKIKENPLKSLIMEIFNKFQADTITTTEEKIRNIEFRTIDDYNLLVSRFIFGLNNDNVNVRNLTAQLCDRLKNFMVDIENVKHILSVSIINKSKNDFDKTSHFENENYNITQGKKTLLLITTLYNHHLIAEVALSEIITYHKNYIIDNVEIKNIDNALYQFHWLLTNIQDKTKIENDKNFLLNFLELNKNKLSTQVRLTCDFFN